MLVLNRGEGQAVRVGDNVEVKVVGISGGRVRLGFTAPLDVTIMRNELVDESLGPHEKGELVSGEEIARLRAIESKSAELILALQNGFGVSARRARRELSDLIKRGRGE